MTGLDVLGTPASKSACSREWLAAILLSFLISLAVVSPFFWLGNATGHDFQYHAASWLDAAGQWKEGVLYPRWTEWANYGFGEPRFIFYPPFSWMLGAALGLIAPWNSVPIAFIVLVQTFAGVSAYALARRVLESRAAALFCVAAYVANPYALLIVYWRSDFAELLADAFYPLFFLAALRLCGLLNDGEETAEPHAYRKIAVFAATFAAIWLCNAPAGVIASYSIAALLAFAAWARRSWQPLARGAAGLLLGLGITAGYLFPAAYEQRWVNIAQALSAGLLPTENFLYTQTLDAEHTLFNWIASTLAVLMIALAGFAALAARRRNGGPDRRSERALWQALLMLSALATLLMLRISSPLWTVLPKLRFVQFPWRWMSLLAVPLAIYLGVAMTRGRLRWLWMVVTFSLLASAAVGLVKSAWWDTEDIPVLRAAIANGQGFDGTDEYDPLGDDHTNIPTKSPEVQVLDTDTMQGPNKKPTIRVERWKPETKEIRVSAPQPFYLGLRLLNYPAWQVELNGAVVSPRGGEDYNMMVVAVAAGESRLVVRFIRTWDRTVGGVVTLGGLVGVLALWRRRTPAPSFL
jgi:uncharacterized membrane protein